MELIFKVDPHEDGEDKARRLLNADNAYCALWEITQELRKILKYDEMPKEVAEKMVKISDKVWEILEDNGIDFGRDWI